MIKIDIKKNLFGSSGKMNLDINLELKKKEFITLTGKNGSGKTTFLRALAGLEDVVGIIKVGDEIWLDEKIVLKTQKRDIGFVFQDYALFLNMSVEENLLFVKKDKKLMEYLLNITELTKLRHRLPHTLSGGQKQRVSLCRALMNKPKLLLMDEPFSALDMSMREKLQEEVLSLHKEFELTTIMVSHDPSEIYKLSNRVLVLEDGEIINDGTAKEILLKTEGSQKFSFEGKILDIIKTDVIYIVIVSISSQIVEVVLPKNEVKNLSIGDRVNVSTKAFSPTIATIE